MPPPRSGPRTGLPRRHLSDLMPSLGRKPDRSPGSAPPAAEDTAQTTRPGWPQPPAAPAKPRARWMLRAQQRPAPATHAAPPQPARLMARAEVHRHVGAENILPNVDAALSRATELRRAIT